MEINSYMLINKINFILILICGKNVSFLTKIPEK
ncbi:MAG: hypothetical protein H6Q21_9 [Bacteroidetes bacterium]|nr:hypothetical protein [Bacteroidota bacterium]